MAQTLVNGILMGSVYALIALGLTLIFGIMRVINFAHGSFLMVSMFVSFISISGIDFYGIHIPGMFSSMPYLSLIIDVPVMFAVGYGVNKFLVQPVLNKEADVREPISALLLTAALGIILDNGFLALFGGDYRVTKTTFSDATMQFGSVSVATARVYAFILCVIVTIIFNLLMNKTEIGRKIRAVGQDRTAARLMGISVEKTFNIAFGLGMALLATAGVAILPFNQLYPAVGGLFGMFAFVTVVLGGLGSVPGAIVGGLIIGIVQSMSTLVPGIEFSVTPAVVLIGFLIFLFIRPSGIFGNPHDW